MSDPTEISARPHPTKDVIEIGFVGGPVVELGRDQADELMDQIDRAWRSLDTRGTRPTVSGVFRRAEYDGGPTVYEEDCA